MDFLKNQSHRILVSLVLVVAALLIFQAGIVVGYHRARFEPIGHGTHGRVVSVASSTFVISDRDDQIEKNVVVASSTAIRRFGGTASSSEIKVGDFVIVLGTPTADGELVAKLIRLLPHE